MIYKFSASCISNFGIKHFDERQVFIEFVDGLVLGIPYAHFIIEFSSWVILLTFLSCLISPTRLLLLDLNNSGYAFRKIAEFN